MNWHLSPIGYCLLALLAVEIGLLIDMHKFLIEEKRRLNDKNPSQHDQPAGKPDNLTRGGFVFCPGINHDSSEIKVLVSENPLGVVEPNVSRAKISVVTQKIGERTW